MGDRTGPQVRCKSSQVGTKTSSALVDVSRLYLQKPFRRQNSGEISAPNLLITTRVSLNHRRKPSTFLGIPANLNLFCSAHLAGIIVSSLSKTSSLKTNYFIYFGASIAIGQKDKGSSYSSLWATVGCF